MSLFASHRQNFEGEIFRRHKPGFDTEEEAQAKSKELWKIGYAVRVTRGYDGKWYLWYR